MDKQIKKPEKIEEFWREFCKVSGVDAEITYDFWYFAHTPEVARKLAELVLKGDKRATTTLLESAQQEGYKPSVGDYSVVTDFDDNPMCIIQMTEIRTLPFDEVDAEYAFIEGEGDKSLEYWREAHQRFFTEDAALNGLEFNEKSLVICEKFDLVYPKK